MGIHSHIKGELLGNPRKSTQNDIRTILLRFYLLKTVFKNVSSSTSHKNTPSLRLSICHFRNLRKFFLTIILRFLWKIYMNANIMNTQTFILIKYDHNVRWRSQKVTFMFILTWTYILMDNFCPCFFYNFYFFTLTDQYF